MVVSCFIHAGATNLTEDEKNKTQRKIAGISGVVYVEQVTGPFDFLGYAQSQSTEGIDLIIYTIRLILLETNKHPVRTAPYYVKTKY